MRINNEFTFVRKRSSVWVRFDQTHITDAIYQAARSIGGFGQDYLLARHDRFPSELTRHVIDHTGRPRPDQQIAETLSDLALHMLNFRMGIDETDHPTIEQIQDAVEYALYASGLIDVYECYRTYRWGRTKLRAREIGRDEFVPSGLPQTVIDQVRAFNEQWDCASLDALNDMVGTHRFRDMVHAGWARFERDLDDIVAMVQTRRPKVLIIAGCSSSGKSTTGRLLDARLHAAGIPVARMELDHYFHDYTNHPRDRHGDYNYETPQALDLYQINRDVERLLAGDVVRPTYYDFESGQQRPGDETYSLEGDKLLVLDSLYGAFPPMTECVPRDEKLIVHVEALHTVALAAGDGQQVRPTDVRMLRRMIRDSRPADKGGRGHPIDKTLGHWHYVRRGELRDLIPYIGTVDKVVNGSFAFDLPVLKGFIEGRFPRLDGFRRRGRIDAFIRGTRAKEILERIRKQPDVSFDVVPRDCIIREFIGYGD